MVTTKTARRLTATSRRARPRWRSHQTPCSPLPAMTSALGYNQDRRQLQLMDGWQASEAWRADLRAEYILSEAGGRGRRRCGVGREADSDQRCQDRCPAIFISKIFSQKIWPKNWGGSSNGGFPERHVCESGSAPPRPRFVQMKTPGGLSYRRPPGGIPAGVFLSARIPVAFRRRAPTVPVARCGITNFSLQKFYPYLQPHPSLRRTAFLATFLPHLTLRDAIRTRGIFGQSPLGSPYNAWRDACTQPRSTGRVCFWLSTGGPSSGAIWQRSGIIMFPGRTTRCESDAPMWARVWVDADEPRISL